MTDPSDNRQTDHLVEALGVMLLLFAMWFYCGVRPGQISLPKEQVAPTPAPGPGAIEAGDAGWFHK